MQNSGTSLTKKSHNTMPTWLAWTMLVAWMVLIFLFSNQPSLPHLPAGWLDLIFKKLAHATAYGILFVLWKNALSRHISHSEVPALLALIFVLGYAISDEWHQSFVPGRHGQSLDVLIDFSGALAIFWTIGWLKTHKTNSPIQ